MLTFEMPAVKCLHGVEVNWSRYRDTSVTDPALVRNMLIFFFSSLPPVEGLRGF